MGVAGAAVIPQTDADKIARDIACHVDGVDVAGDRTIVQNDAVSSITTRRDIACHIEGVDVGARTIDQIDAVRIITTRRDIACHVDGISVADAVTVIKFDALNNSITYRDIA